MVLWDLSNTPTEELLELPETGMGFQWVEDFVGRRLLVLNASLAYDATQLELTAAADPAAVLANGARLLDALRSTRAQFVGRPEPTRFALLASRVNAGPVSQQVGRGVPAPQITLPSALVKRVTLTEPRRFHRYSAFRPDRRVDPTTGAFLPGTYAVPESEVPFIPTGFAAVGRLALPNVQPASHHYILEAPSGTVVEFGTVAPGFGQAGGGVEALFPNGADNLLGLAAPAQIPDE